MSLQKRFVTQHTTTAITYVEVPDCLKLRFDIWSFFKLDSCLKEGFAFLSENLNLAIDTKTTQDVFDFFVGDLFILGDVVTVGNEILVDLLFVHV